MQIIVEFLRDAAKIVFGSAVVGFFIPGLVGDVSFNTFIIGVIATVVLLVLAVILSKQKKPI